MAKSKFFLFAVALFVLGWFMLFQGAQPAGASPLLGITLTPTAVPPTPTRQVPQVTVTPTSVPVVPTLPPPSEPQSTPVIIPVTGTDASLPAGSLENLGLVLLALGLITAGITSRRK